MLEHLMSGVTFNGFVVSLATTAAIHFGDVADPATGRPAPANLEAAGQAIEMLALLEAKTAGNLTAGEAAFLGEVLVELRRRLVEEHGKQTRPALRAAGRPSGEAT